MAKKTTAKTKFQFTLPRGERPYSQAGVGAGQMFQFTLPRGERLRLGRLNGWRAGFNSRSREGSDREITPS